MHRGDGRLEKRYDSHTCNTRELGGSTGSRPKTEARNSKQYFLREYVHCCITSHAAVFLDTKHDTYLGVPLELTSYLSGLVAGWPECDRSIAFRSDDAEMLLTTLTEKGVLTVDRALGNPAIPPSLPAVQQSLASWDTMGWKHIRARHVIRFLNAYLWTVVSLRLRGLHYVLTALRERKERQSQHRRALDLDAARRLIAAFYHIRPFIYGKKGRCLVDSVTLLEFLAAHALHPTLVIGVRTRPFGAHSWIQHGQYVLNGTPEYVRAYTPILSI
ncbi:MAG TPA: lasso peptide biosynthesis B2 protein [Steroidobacter sp.]